LVVAGYPAHPLAANAIYSTSILSVMAAKATTGEMKPKDAMKWCAKEIEMVTG
jgi:hypothetical protein